ncbi:glycoside hydrolase [Mycotypha africana]|uniref:glycoside hydrolase n=1 Tax=Mycotypha africana TaxID=64632 RepID=UPI002300CF4E|nr:glycoside hydrolase [Mycotypha africana]KAI8984576.1 glycoside hydrolase [Mycotypha africana]
MKSVKTVSLCICILSVTARFFVKETQAYYFFDQKPIIASKSKQQQHHEQQHATEEWNYDYYNDDDFSKADPFDNDNPLKTRQQIRKDLGTLPDSYLLTPREKQKYIQDAFVFSWEGYKNYSWGYDENRPVSNGPRNTRNGWGATIVDALDTLYIMGMHHEFRAAQRFVARIDWDRLISNDEPVQLFETVIRYVGGLLSAYELSHENVFITKAVELVERLLPAFDTPTGIPYQYVDFTTGEPVKNEVVCLAEIGTIQIEFTRLSQITGNWKYHNIGQRVYDTFVNKDIRRFGLFPHLINVKSGEPVGNHITWGGMGDSFYEYLIKQLVIAKGKDPAKWQMVSEVISSLENYLLVDSPSDRHASFLALLESDEQVLQMDELACFAPGTLLLLARTFPREYGNIETIATRLMNGCYSAWDLTATGLAPEVFSWAQPDPDIGDSDTDGNDRKKPAVYPIHPSYILRPETIESLYYFYVYTHDPIYQDMAWDIFSSMYTYCKAKSGYSGVTRVDVPTKTWDDREESFFFAETLKYLYLIFDDPKHPRFPFDKWVFNTEAHPLRMESNLVPTTESSNTRNAWKLYQQQ